MKAFRALRIDLAAPRGQPMAQVRLVQLQDLTDGEVVIEVHYSGVNYKDALAATGRGKILRTSPLNGGVDASGIVVESSDKRFTPGDKVLVTGCGLSETFDGGYSEILRVQGDSVVPLPQGLSLREAMILGTAGFTAALALHRMRRNGQEPEQGPILVTGASGGVGQFAVEMFTKAGFEVFAVSGKSNASTRLRALGASQVLAPEDLKLGSRPLEGIRFGGAVDNVGGPLLAQILAHTQLWGNVASIGLALSTEFHATVMPFILRGVSLLGISSNNCERGLRHQLWRGLASSRVCKPDDLESAVARTVNLDGLGVAFEDLLERKVTGRILVEIKREG